jgi:predicted DNA-binding transcriptional regulator AlpA
MIDSKSAYQYAGPPGRQRESLRGLDIDQLRERLGGKKPLDPSTVWRRTKSDPDFPQPFYLWDAAPRWVETEVDDYIRKKIAQRDDPVAAAAQRERVDRRERLTAPRRAEARKAKVRRRKRAPAAEEGGGRASPRQR